MRIGACGATGAAADGTGGMIAETPGGNSPDARLSA